MQDSLRLSAAVLCICIFLPDSIGIRYCPGYAKAALRHAIHFELLKTWRKLYIYVHFSQIDLLQRQ